MIPVMATLGIGILIGYLGQRSKFCTISGIRDLYLVKDWSRFKGLLGLLVGAVVAFAVFKQIGGNIVNFPTPLKLVPAAYLIPSVLGGLGLGFFSVLAEGCPFRQHVMAAEGRQSASFYLVGFYLGIVYFNIVTVKFLDLFVAALG